MQWWGQEGMVLGPKLTDTPFKLFVPPEVDVVGPVHEGVAQPPLVPGPEQYVSNRCETNCRDT